MGSYCQSPKLISTVMRCLWVLGLLLIIAQGMAAKKRSKGSFKACPNSPDKYVKPWSVSYKPKTIVAKKGKKISVHFDAQVLKEIPKGVKVEVKVKTKGAIRGIGRYPIPCLELDDFPISVGSCNYTGEELLKVLEHPIFKDIDCEKYLPKGQKCALPFKPGFYGVKDKSVFEIQAKIPKIPDVLKPFIGDIFVKVRARHPKTKKEMFCKQATIKIKGGKSFFENFNNFLLG